MGHWSEYLPVGNKDINIVQGIRRVYISDSYKEHALSLTCIKGRTRTIDSDDNNLNPALINLNNVVMFSGARGETQINIRGKNQIPLINSDMGDTYTFLAESGMQSYWDHGRGTLGFSGTPSDNWTGSYDIYMGLNLIAHEKYVLNGVPESLKGFCKLVLRGYDSEDNLVLTAIDSGDGVEFETLSEISYYDLTLDAEFAQGVTYYGIVQPMIRFKNAGSAKYEEYAGNGRTYKIHIQYELYRLDDVYDELSVIDGVWQYTKRIEQRCIDDTNQGSWSPIDLAPGKRAWICTTPETWWSVDGYDDPSVYYKAHNGKILCDCLPVYESMAELALHDYGVVSTADTLIILPCDENDAHEYLETEDNMRAWLADYCPLFLYELATPYTLPVSEPTAGTGIKHPSVLEELPCMGRDTVVTLVHSDHDRTDTFSEIVVCYPRTEQGVQQLANERYLRDEVGVACVVNTAALNGYKLFACSQDVFDSMAEYDTNTLYIITE